MGTPYWVPSPSSLKVLLHQTGTPNQHRQLTAFNSEYGLAPHSGHFSGFSGERFSDARLGLHPSRRFESALQSYVHCFRTEFNLGTRTKKAVCSGYGRSPHPCRSPTFVVIAVVAFSRRLTADQSTAFVQRAARLLPGATCSLNPCAAANFIPHSPQARCSRKRNCSSKGVNLLPVVHLSEENKHNRTNALRVTN